MSKPTDWKLRLDSILHDARAEAAGRQPAGKTASAPTQAAPATLVKQAEDVVAAIKLVTGQTSQATLAEILRKEGEAGKSPGVTSTTTGGTQAEPPRSGSASVTQSPGPKAARPTESAAGTKGASLHDIITRGREAAEKSAGKGGPAELEAGDPSGKTPAGLTKLVGTSEAVVDMTKRDALAQTRPSLQSLLKNVNDSANEAAARAAFPAAVAKGGLKIASDLELARSLQKQAEDAPDFERARQRQRATWGGIQALQGGLQGAEAGLVPAAVGALGGAVQGDFTGRSRAHLMRSVGQRDAEHGRHRTLIPLLVGPEAYEAGHAQGEPGHLDPEFEAARARQMGTYGALSAAAGGLAGGALGGAAGGAPGALAGGLAGGVLGGASGALSGAVHAHQARSMGQRGAEEGPGFAQGLKRFLMGPKAYDAGHAQGMARREGGERVASASDLQLAIAMQRQQSAAAV